MAVDHLAATKTILAADLPDGCHVAGFRDRFVSGDQGNAFAYRGRHDEAIPWISEHPAVELPPGLEDIQAMGGLRLNAVGIGARETRTTILLELAGEMPAAVIADMLGLYPNTAVRWVHAAAGDWTSYAARRSRSA